MSTCLNVVCFYYVLGVLSGNHENGTHVSIFNASNFLLFSSSLYTRLRFSIFTSLLRHPGQHIISLLLISQFRKKLRGTRSFLAPVPKLWNLLPLHAICSAFLKTVLVLTIWEAAFYAFRIFFFTYTVDLSALHLIVYFFSRTLSVNGTKSSLSVERCVNINM